MSKLTRLISAKRKKPTDDDSDADGDVNDLDHVFRANPSSQDVLDDVVIAAPEAKKRKAYHLNRHHLVSEFQKQLKMSEEQWILKGLQARLATLEAQQDSLRRCTLDALKQFALASPETPAQHRLHAQGQKQIQSVGKSRI